MTSRPARAPLSLVLLLCVCATTAGAQILMRPDVPPQVSASSEPWFVSDEPILFNGILYFRAGPNQFFDGNVMVRVGYYRTLPIYGNTTLEQNSVILVPVDGGMLQPYERLRDGDVAGTTGSRTPEFPVTPSGAATYDPDRVGTMQGPPVGPDYMPFEPMDRPESALGSGPAPEPVGTAGYPPSAAIAPPPAAPRGTWRSALAPQATLGVWIEYGGDRWSACGPAELLQAGVFERVGEYRGFPVYTRRAPADGAIFLPSLGDFIAPYLRGPVVIDDTGCRSAGPEERNAPSGGAAEPRRPGAGI